GALMPPPGWSGQRFPPASMPLPSMPSVPAMHAQTVAQQSAKAIDWMAKRLGPFPYGSLSLTQMPGKTSQGWPGLIYLSSYVFMTTDQRLKLSALDSPLYSKVIPAPETP